MLSESSLLISSFNKSIDSTSDSEPMNPPTELELTLSIFDFIIENASFQLTSENVPFSLTRGFVRRCTFNPSIENLALSSNHSSLISLFIRGIIRNTSLPLASILVFEHTLSNMSMDSVDFNSQGRALKA